MCPPSTAFPHVQAPKTRLPAWLGYSLLAIVLWGTWGATSKAISGEISAYTNQVFFAAGLLPVIAVVRRSHRLGGGPSRRRGIVYAFVTGVLGGTGNIAFFIALSHSGKASVVVPVTSLSPLVTVVLGYFVLRERITLLQKAGLALALVAIYLLSL